MAIYARVSTEEQAETGYSIDAQLDTLRGYCKSNHRIVVGEYVDAGVSGKSTAGRKELQRLLRDAELRTFDEVVVWKISRMARNTLDLLNIVECLGKYDIHFRSFSENFETETPMGRFALQMMGAVSELERNQIVDNVKLGLKQRARSGKWNGGIMLGYESVAADDGKEKALAVVPKEAALVRKIFELYASGRGLKSIANQLNHEGHKTKRGGAFSAVAIGDILRNPVYVGKIRYNRREDWNSKRRRQTSELIIAEGQHEAIISDELWSRVQALYDSKSGRTPRTFDGSYPLTGLLRCPECGAGMVAARSITTRKSGKKVVIRYYYCGNFRNKGSAVCHSNSIRADEAESFVFGKLAEIVRKPKLLRQVVARANEKLQSSSGPLRQELAAVREALDDNKARQEKYFKLYESDGISADALVARLDSLKEDASRLSKRVDEITRQLSANASTTVDYAQTRYLLSNLQRFLAKADPGQTKTLLQLLIKRISLDRDRKPKNMEICLGEAVQRYIEHGPTEQVSVGPSLSLNQTVRLEL